MNNFFVDHLDFVYLLYGLIFFLLALTVGSMVKRRGNSADWRYLCAFGVLHGLNEWLNMLVPAMGAKHWFSILHGLILTGSFFCLFEFGRRSVVWNRKWKAGVWIYYPGLLVILLGVKVDPSDFTALIRVNLGFPAGILAALALWQGGMMPGDELRRSPNFVGPWALCLYAVITGLILPSAHFWPANHFNEQWFLANTGIPVQVFRCLLAGALTLILWYDYDNWKARTYPSEFARRIRYVHWIACIAVMIVVCAGWFLVERAEQQCRSEHERRLMSISRGMAAVMNAREVMELKGNKDDLEAPSYLDLKRQCQRICEADAFIRYVYLLAVREGKVVFLLDSEPGRFSTESDKALAAPGEVYESPPAEIMGVFHTRVPVVSKLYSDAWGMFVSGYAPILDAAGNVVALLGIDEPGEQWLSDIAFARMLRLFLTGGGLLLLLLFTVLWRREIEESQIKNAVGRRMQQHQSALLKIANSSFVADGNIYMMARAVTCVTAEVINVERVEFWLKMKNDEKFRSEDVYQTGTATHTSGRISCVAEGDSYLKLLEEGRAVLSSNFQNDDRFDVIREELGGDARAVLVAPLRVSGKLSGWLTAIQTSKCRNWLTDEMRFVAEMADQVTHTLINNERRLAEEALLKAHGELEMRIQARTEALSLKNEELSREINERLRIEDEKRSLQAKMQQAQKLESLGLMAGGIAHDFNNILMAVLGNVELARLETPAGSPIYDYLQDIDKASCRAAELARQMLIYSGRGHASIQGINLNDMVSDMTSMLKVSLGKKVQLAYELEPNLPLVDGDLTQLRQVLMNLVINASEAIGNENGLISLKTGVIQCDHVMFSSMWLKDDLPVGKYVFVDVIDSGCGMDEPTAKRIFDPFFTTKFTGRGLGLAAVLGIIKGHHGTIDVVSQVGKGTRFRVLLPMGCKESDKVILAPDADKAAWQGSGVILLADDEETVRTLGRRMLERIGFTVLEASDGNEAIDVFKKEHARILCVLLDLTMPNMDGKEALDMLREIDPVMKIILCSGYMVDNIVESFPDWNVSGYLQKPYKLDALVSVLQNVLN